MATPVRRYRCPEDLWLQVQSVATGREETATDVILRAFKAYVADPETTTAVLDGLAEAEPVKPSQPVAVAPAVVSPRPARSGELSEPAVVIKGYEGVIKGYEGVTGLDQPVKASTVPGCSCGCKGFVDGHPSNVFKCKGCGHLLAAHRA